MKYCRFTLGMSWQQGLEFSFIGSEKLHLWVARGVGKHINFVLLLKIFCYLKKYNIMKIQHIILTAVLSVFFIEAAHAQFNILERAKKRLEQKINQKINQKIDQKLEAVTDSVVNQVVTVEESLLEKSSYAEEKDVKKTVNSKGLKSTIKGNAEDCNWMQKYKKGTKIQRSFYDKKGDLVNTADILVSEIKNVATGWNLTMTMYYKDEKGKVKGNTSSDYKCENGVFTGNLLNFSDYESDMSKDPNTKFSVTGELPQYSNLEVGKSQPDAEFEFKAIVSNLTLMKIKCQVLNRKVVAFEKVTTLAGTFDCYKIESDTEMKIFFKTHKLHSIEFFNKDYGSIKSISFDKKGQVDNSSELTKFTE
jgi:hypothetical protein